MVSYSGGSKQIHFIEKQKLEEAKARATQKNKEAKQEQAIKNAKAVSGGIPKDVLQRAREGLGLEGVRVEKDTSGCLLYTSPSPRD